MNHLSNTCGPLAQRFSRPKAPNTLYALTDRSSRAEAFPAQFHCSVEFGTSSPVLTPASTNPQAETACPPLRPALLLGPKEQSVVAHVVSSEATMQHLHQLTLGADVQMMDIPRTKSLGFLASLWKSGTADKHAARC